MGFTCRLEDAPFGAIGDEAEFECTSFAMSWLAQVMFDQGALDTGADMPEVDWPEDPDEEDPDAYWAARFAATAIDSGRAVPAYKLACNDGWLIMPAEIERSLPFLQPIEANIRAETGEYLKGYPSSAVPGYTALHVSLRHGIVPPDWADLYNRWIAFLKEGAARGGVRVW